MKRPNKLLRELRKALGPELQQAFRSEEVFLDDSKWKEWFGRVVTSATRLEFEVERNRRRIAEAYGDFENLPPGRQAVIWRSSPPQMLVALGRDLIESSYMFRFKDAERSLQLAELGLETVVQLDESALPGQARADLEAEAWAYLGNARRINGDLAGAADALRRAEESRVQGSGDRHLKADLLNLNAYLEFRRGDARAAAGMLDRSIQLWRLMGQDEFLGQTLLDRAIVATWVDSVDAARELILEAMRFTSDPIRSILALSALAERLARDGEGTPALRTVCSRDALIVQTGLGRMGFETLLRRCDWITGLAYFSLQDLGRAQAELERVHASYVEEKDRLLAAMVSLDLAAVYAAQGRADRVKALAEEAWAVFRAEGLEQRALAAFQVLHQAARAERATAELAVRVANFVTRAQVDRGLRFEREA